MAQAEKVDEGNVVRLERQHFKSRIVNVGPKTAENYLKTSPGNRSISEATVNAYALSMTAGKWVLTPQALLFDTEGRLRDGHHRMWAVLKSGAVVPFLRIDGVSEEVVRHIDQGRQRSVADSLAIEGSTYTTLISAMARAILQLSDLNGHKLKMTRAQFDDVMEKFGPDILECSHHSRVSMPTPGAAAFAYALPISRVKIWALYDQCVKREVEHGSAGAAILRAYGDSHALHFDRRGVMLKVLLGIQKHLSGEQVTLLKAAESGFEWAAKERAKRKLPTSVYATKGD